MILVTPNGEHAAVSVVRHYLEASAIGSGLSIATLDLRDLAQPPHRQLSLPGLRTLSEIVSTRRVEGSGTTRMTLDEWLQRWQSFRTARPTYHDLNDFRTTISDFAKGVRLAQREVQTLHQQAETLQEAGEYERAAAAYTHAIDLRSQNVNALLRRANVLALSGRWEEVVEDFARYVEYAGYSEPAWFRHALLRLHVAGVDEYRRVCSDLMKRFGTTKDPLLANNLAWSCALGPKAVPDLTQCVALAEGAAAAKPESRSLRNTLGAILYRSGDFAGAVKHLNKSIELHGKGGSATDWLFLAMSHHRLNHPDEARQWFEKATQWIGEHIGWDGAKKVSWEAFHWYSRLTLTLFHREAESLLSGREPGTQKDAGGVVKDPERLKAVIKKLDDALETSFRKASSGKE